MLDALNSTDQLPRTIFYNLRFLDNTNGMIRQLDSVANNGMLSKSIGMLTDSRSFLSFPRHEYYRRILCNYIGEKVENGEFPNDIKYLSGMVKDICFNNINATSENGCFIGGDTPTKVSGIYFNAVNINLYKKTNYQTGVYDKRPCVGESFIYDKTYGIYVDKATGVVANAFLVQFDPSFPQELYGVEKHGF